MPWIDGLGADWLYSMMNLFDYRFGFASGARATDVVIAFAEAPITAGASDLTDPRGSIDKVS